MPLKNVFVLDTSALLALRSNEAGADRVESLLLQAKREQCQVFLSFMTRMELLYSIWREEGEEAAREAMLIHKDPEFTKFKGIPQEVLR